MESRFCTTLKLKSIQANKVMFYVQMGYFFTYSVKDDFKSLISRTDFKSPAKLCLNAWEELIVVLT